MERKTPDNFLTGVLKRFLGLLLFLLPWQTIWMYQERFLNGAKWEYGTLGLYGTEVLLWAAVFVFIVWYVKRGNFQFSIFNVQFSKDRIFLLLCFVFIIYAFLSSLWATDGDVARQQALRIMEAFLLFLMLYVGPLKFKEAAAWFVGGAVIQSMLGIWQFLSQFTFGFKWLGLVSHPAWQAGTSVVSSPDVGRWLRAYGAFPHPNIFGGYIVFALVVLLLLWYKSEIRNPPSPRPSAPSSGRGAQAEGKSEIFYLTSYFLLLTSLFFTFSRSAWIAGIIVLLFHCFIVYKNYRTETISYQLSAIISALVLIVFLATLFFPLVRVRLSGDSEWETRSIAERQTGFQEAWTLFLAHPWFGVGAGNYTAALHQLDAERPGWEYQPAHNVPALFIVELGIVGSILFIAVIVSFITYHVSRITYHIRINTNWYVICVTCYVVLALFDHYLLSSYVGLLMTAVYWGVLLRPSRELLHR